MTGEQRDCPLCGATVADNNLPGHIASDECDKEIRTDTVSGERGRSA